MKINSYRTYLKGLIFIVMVSIAIFNNASVYAQPSSIDINLSNGAGDALATLDVFILLLLLSVIPSIVLMMTSFTRIIIVFSFLRNALGLQQSPPNQVLVGISLFLTLFIMNPVITIITETAYEPYSNEEITQQEAIDLAIIPVKEFMLRQVDSASMSMFLDISNTTLEITDETTVQEQMMGLGLEVIVPAFVTSELKRAFLIGFLLFVPFLIIDLIVASTLMSMGMVMLPPGMISLPFKIMVFILADGWGLLMQSLIRSFN
jgi:flagellar biosynthetic protein FliP